MIITISSAERSTPCLICGRSRVRNPGPRNLTQRCKQFATASTSTQVFALALWCGDEIVNSLHASA